jgi:branched-chain amino acid transport system substrate-binding protein
MRRRLLATSALLAAALALAGCGSSSSGSGAGGSAGTPYRVMLTGGFSASGVLLSDAQTSLLGVKAAVKQINAEGGIDGHKVVLTQSDDAGDPTTAVTNLLNAIHSGSKPDAYFNSGPSSIAQATLPILTSNHILSFNIGPTTDSSDASKFPYNFDLSPGPPDYAKAFVPALKAAGYKTVGIIHGNDAYGTAVGQDFQSAFTAAGITVTSNQAYNVTALDMTAQLQTVQASKPDALIMDGFGAPVGYMLQDLQRLGWNVPILADNSVAVTGLVFTAAPTGMEGTDLVKNLKMQVFTSTVYSPSDTAVNHVVSAMAAFGQITAPLILAYDYDALPLIAAAAKYAHSTDPTVLAKALANPAAIAGAHTVVLSGYHFTATNHSPQPGPSELTFISPSLLVNGQFGHS